MKRFLILVLLTILLSCSNYQTLNKGDRIRLINIESHNRGKYGIVTSNMMKDRFGNDSWCLVRFDSSNGLSGVILVDLVKIENKGI